MLDFPDFQSQSLSEEKKKKTEKKFIEEGSLKKGVMRGWGDTDHRGRNKKGRKSKLDHELEEKKLMMKDARSKMADIAGELQEVFGDEKRNVGMRKRRMSW